MAHHSKDLDPYTSPRAFYGSELRRLREGSGLSQEGLGDRAFCSGAYIGQFETGARRPQEELSRSFDEILGSGQHMQRLCALARESKHPDYFADAAEMERHAATFCEYLPMVVPGFLQTEAYARAQTRASMPLASDAEVEERVATRMERARRLLDSTGPKLWAILHEAALYVAVGGAEVMAGQLAHVASVGRAGQVIVQVQPFSAGAHPIMANSLILMTFPDAPAVAYVESAHTGQLIDEPALVAEYQASYDLARAAALPLTASLELVEATAKDWKP
ncbi:MULTISPECIES: helix-turn-helix transcriptional regulator [unclassified Streptomyces]|uniref:helix-turn-helix domain-containing protein n=1 Tax=unclassified Streptomyces TaxID=2593676 RepID=UPI002DDA6836|nr:MULTISPECIES: helix-turn-helix transcriptional regulator [unclassified Streptomyces]WSB76519.1 helix-turn-helix domain-containing protein [Streptomyces sp. NBC_01775]WSS15192.1 helix-turn-helix domain-containing protein [Streptomyces sp. NBC_01186]WSS44034.1 helix-turn-helix domain-containing protein [Streptomyces sp. NBC_01187]